jgi:DNA-directed RNA polymerase subunit M/transcription elongation factor TFIIS
MEKEIDVPCPDCGEEQMVASLEKQIAEALLNMPITFERIMNLLINGEIDSKLKESVKSVECKNCGNKERQFDQSLARRGLEAKNQREEET